MFRTFDLEKTRGIILAHILYAIIFLFFSKTVYFNVVLYNSFGVGSVSMIDYSSMDSEGSGGTSYELTTKNKKKLHIIYVDDGNDPLGFVIGDIITFRYIGGSNVQVLKRNGIEIAPYFQFIDYFSFIMTILLLLGYYFIPKFYKKEENEENKRITKSLDDNRPKDNGKIKHINDYLNNNRR